MHRIAALREERLLKTRGLIAAGADVALKNNDGKTAADLATEKGYDELAELLKYRPQCDFRHFNGRRESDGYA